MNNAEFQISDTIAGVDPQAWDTITADSSVFVSRPCLAALEQSGVPGMGHRYLLLRRENTPVLAMSVQILDISGTRLARSAPDTCGAGAPSVLSRVAAGLRDVVLLAMGGRVAVCGNFFSTGPHGLAFAPGVDPAQAWPLAVEALQTLRTRDSLAQTCGYTMFKDIPPEWQAAGDRLRAGRYHSLQTEPDMVLELQPEWKSHEDYLDALKAKYRKAAREIFDAVTEAGFDVAPLGDVSAHAERIYGLYHNVESRAAVRLASFGPGYLPALAAALGEGRFRCLAVRRGGELSGFMAVVKDGGDAFAYYAGLDYAMNAHTPVYHRLLHAVIGQALEWRCRRVCFGRTALDAKARLGAGPKPLSTWLRRENPLLNFAGGALLALIPPASAPVRRPFRDFP